MGWRNKRRCSYGIEEVSEDSEEDIRVCSNYPNLEQGGEIKEQQKGDIQVDQEGKIAKSQTGMTKNRDKNFLSQKQWCFINSKKASVWNN